MVNAARHSGAPEVAVYEEVEPELVTVFVRDRGRGFDPRRRHRPGRDRRVDHRADAPQRWHRGHPLPSRPRHRGRAVDEAHSRVTASAPRVFLVDDHHLFRSGVRTELGAHADVVGEASEVDAAIEMIGERLPDVVLVDVHMPAGGGEAVIRGVLAEHPDVRFLALSVSDAPEDVIAVIRAGARGYVTKTISGPELVDAIRRVAADDAVFSPRLAGFVLDAFSHVPVDAVDPELDQLTARARGASSHRARVRVQGDRPAARHLHQDGGVTRVVGVAQAAALEPTRAHAVGDRASHRLTRRAPRRATAGCAPAPRP